MIRNFVSWVVLVGTASSLLADEWLEQPVDDATFQAYLEFFDVDDALPFRTESHAVEEGDGFRREHLSFQSTPGERVTAFYYQPSGTSPSGGTLIFLHGGGPRGKDHATYTVMSERLARGGWNVLMIDAPHFGERQTGLLETFTEQEKHDVLYNQRSVYLAWITQYVKDVRRAFDFLVVEKAADESAIGLFARSRGAIAGTIAGAVETRLAAILLYFGGHFDALETGHHGAACPANYIGRIGARPLYTINADNDGDMDAERSVRPLHRLIDPATEHTARWTHGGHSYASDEDWAAMFAWLREALGSRARE
jgi:pimeloyl-ACP methyl ester carboxylesterase